MENAGEGSVSTGVPEPAGVLRAGSPRGAAGRDEPAPVRSPVSHRLRRRPGRLRRVLRSRGFIVSVAVFVLAVVAAGVWAVQRVRAVEAAVAEAQSHSAAFQAAVTSGDDATARSELHALQSATARARALTSGTAWRLGGYAPFVGGSVSAARDLLCGRRRGEPPGPAVAAERGAAVRLADPRQRRSPGSTWRLWPAHGTTSQRAQAALDPLRARLAAVPASGLIGPIGGARATLAADLDEAARRLSAAGSNLSIAVPMLGGDGPRNYLIMLQDPAIAAGPGGGIVAYALVSADPGQFNLVQVGGPQDLPVPGCARWSRALTSRTWRSAG